MEVPVRHDSSHSVEALRILRDTVSAEPGLLDPRNEAGTAALVEDEEGGIGLSPEAERRVEQEARTSSRLSTAQIFLTPHAGCSATTRWIPASNSAVVAHSPRHGSCALPHQWTSSRHPEARRGEPGNRGAGSRTPLAPASRP